MPLEAIRVAEVARLRANFGRAPDNRQRRSSVLPGRRRHAWMRENGGHIDCARIIRRAVRCSPNVDGRRLILEVSTEMLRLEITEYVRNVLEIWLPIEHAEYIEL